MSSVNIKLNNSELIKQIQNTEEYKRSCAIAEAIRFLNEQILTLQKQSEIVCEENAELNKKLAEQAKLMTKIKSENALFQNESKLLKTKLAVTEKLNKTLEQTINELNEKLASQQNLFNNKCDQFSSILKEYKNVFEELKVEKLGLEQNLAKVVKESNSLKNQNETMKHKIETLIQESKRNDLITKKLKDYELLLYKIDLENQTFKQEIKNYQKLNESVVPIKKIDLNSELNTIENDYNDKVVGTAVNLCTETENQNTDNNNMLIITDRQKNSSLDNMDLAGITKEIKNTEKTLKEYSNMLLQKENNDNQASSQEFKDIMSVMENETEKLIDLKKKYNQLIKCSI